MCLHAGILDVEAWRDSLDGTRILNFWEAFNHIEPIGLPALDQMFAVQSSWMVSSFSQQEQHIDEFRAFPDYTKSVRGAATDAQRRSKAAAEQSKFA